jgi:long-chain fatty acid transport protein
MKKLYTKSALISATLALSVSCAQAGGFMVQETSSAVGQANAGRAVDTSDGSMMFWNPAVMAYQDKHQLILQNYFIMPRSKLHNATTQTTSAVGVPTTIIGGNGGNGGKFAYVPATYAIVNASKKFKFGLGITSPFGLETNYKPGAVTRYIATKSRLITVNVNPAIAYHGECFALGFGVSFERAEADLEKEVAADFRLVRGTRSDIHTKVRGTNNAFGLNFGAIFETSARSRVGIAYRSSISHNIKGNLTFNNLPSFGLAAPAALAFVDQRVSASLKTPDVVNLSGKYCIDDAWSVLGDVMFTRWTVLRQIQVTAKTTGAPLATEVQSWKNTVMASLGVHYKYGHWLGRAGVAYDQSPTRNRYRSPRLPDQDRVWLALGADYNWCDELVFKLQYAHIFVRDAKINNSVAATNVPIPGLGALPLFPGSTVTGKYKNKVNILGFQVMLKL